MKLFNSKSNKIETFKSIEPNKVSLYLCGPTVYNHAHIGNARPIVVFDLLRRVLSAEGYDVKFVSNYTDIDDRIIEKAQNEGVLESVISERYIQAYEKVRDSLYAGHVDVKPQVTHVIDDIVNYISELESKDYAYEAGGDVYFKVDKVPTYGQISHQKLDALKVGARIEENESKKNPLDFVLWKQTDDMGIKWDSPWGKGRPGWHTECVVMINDAFGDIIDIHAGGQDLKFPHHENESAHSYAMHDHDIANYWLHCAMLQIDGEKMSKSLGNVLWAQDYIDRFGANVTRWLLLSTHYRLVLNISEDTINQSIKEVKRIEDAMKQATLKLSLMDVKIEGSVNEATYTRFLEPLKDDLNVANALVVLFDHLKELNQSLRVKDIDVTTLSDHVVTLEKMLNILGIEVQRTYLEAEDKALYEKWNSAKANKDFETADTLRSRLIEKGLL